MSLAPSSDEPGSAHSSAASQGGVAVRKLGKRDYESTWQAMRAFTEARTPLTPDEVWLVQHPSVFTLGLSRDHSHVLDVGDFPIVNTDRGGQVTYHGPGQLLSYVLLDLRRAHIGLRELVHGLEQSVIDLLQSANVEAARRRSAPGVYVGNAKVASLGLRVRRGCCYHGMALNVCMDLSPFSMINPCGYPGLRLTQLCDLGIEWDIEEAGRRWLERLAPYLTG